jgi:hypothetical protein
LEAVNRKNERIRQEGVTRDDRPGGPLAGRFDVQLFTPEGLHSNQLCTPEIEQWVGDSDAH